ncbi:hypothetical protein CIK81_05260 [Brachybacterium sp. JB7]|uniref:DUF5666 domain-containing protein n=1 Tax=Brachybacterium alimentarium TaxID=47845 RepID=A0A2A3YN73_9MICO|nr:hypothetical protein CIK66_02900 [Brachybacterium alimentarium]RCS65601.1 hypothetical protein CIK81_05260 [Brachybacterium sp. JB7]RCS66732.1 hypothetical protein CIK73_11630 [Brachybacterium alimentarium]
MTRSILLRCATAAAALTFTLAACGQAQDGTDAPGSDGGADSNPAVESSEDPAPSDGGADSDSADGAGAEESAGESADDPKGEDSGADADAGDDSETGEDADAATDTLTITLDGEDTEITPDIVRCSGGGGSIRNVVIKSQSGLPLVKVTPGEFAMVKMNNRGEPEKSSSTADITAEDGTVSFDEASIGGAVVDGTVTCLQGDDD